MRRVARVGLAACLASSLVTSAGCGPESVVSDDARAILATLDYAALETIPDPSNAFDDDPLAQRLGQTLFFDPALSGPLIDRDNDGSAGTLGSVGETGRIACSSCHVPEAGFVDVRSPHRQISLAASWTARRTPTLLDIGSSTFFNWDGRRDALWNQALGVVEASSEFNSSRLYLAEQVFAHHRADYEAIFGPMPPLDDALRFPQLAPAQAGCEGATADAICHGKPGAADYDAMSEADRDAVTRVAVDVSKAIAAYVGRLRCGPSRFDAWLAGDPRALSTSEQRGAELFVGRAGCVQCHAGPRFTDDAFHNVGLRPATVATAFTDLDDRGAALGFADAASDPLGANGSYGDGTRTPVPPVVASHEGAFKTPTLRCIARQPSFMHTGQMRTLEEVVAFFAQGGHPGGFPGTSEIGPLDLDAGDQADLVAFIRALEGEGPAPELLVP